MVILKDFSFDFIVKIGCIAEFNFFAKRLVNLQNPVTLELIYLNIHLP